MTRKNGNADFVEVYTSPLWFTKNSFDVSKPRRNKKKGTATLAVEVPGPGSIQLRGKSLARSGRTLPAAGTAKLAVKPKGRLKKRLKKRGKLTVRPRITFKPDGGDPHAEKLRVKLIRK